MVKIAHHCGIEARIAIKAIKARQQTNGFKTLADGHADQLGRYGNRDGGNDDIESFGPAIGRHQKAAAVHFDTPYGCAGSHIDSFGYQRVFHDRVHLLESGPRARKRGPALSRFRNPPQARRKPVSKPGTVHQRSEEQTYELPSLMRNSYAV